MEEMTTVGSEAPEAGIPQGEQPVQDSAQLEPRQGEVETPSEEAAATRDEGGRFTKPVRTVEELHAADPQSWTKEERVKVRKAGSQGIETEAEYLTKFGSAKTAGVAPKGEGEAPEATPAAEKPADKTNPLAQLVKAIHPALDPEKPEEAVKSIKALQGAHTQASQKVREYETRVLPEIENGLISRLKKGAEGVREIYQSMGLEAPAFLSQGAAAPAPQAAPQGGLEALKDDDFLDGSQVKALVPKLIADAVKAAVAEVHKEYGEVKETHGKIKDRLLADAKAEEVKQTRAEALSDAQFHSDFWGDAEPGDRLKDKADKIWAESVDANGFRKPEAERHPEWPKLEKILLARRKEFLEGDSKAATYQHYLMEKLHKSGKYEEVLKARAKAAQLKLVTQQQRRVQPALVPKAAAPGGIQGMRIPKTEAELRAMDPKERRELVKKAGRGDIAVTGF